MGVKISQKLGTEGKVVPCRQHNYLYTIHTFFHCIPTPSLWDTNCLHFKEQEAEVSCPRSQSQTQACDITAWTPTFHHYHWGDADDNNSSSAPLTSFGVTF